MSTESVTATFVQPASGTAIEAVTGSGFAVALDSPPTGEPRTGPGPMEAVLAALAGCTALDVASILRKKRQTVRGYRIAITGERATEHPMVFTRIRVEHQVVGDVDAEALRRSIELSATRYCPVSAMLSRSVEIEHRYRLWQQVAEGEGIAARVAVTAPAGTTLG